MGAPDYTVRRAGENDAAGIVRWFPTHESAVLWGGGDVPKPLTAQWLQAQFRSRRYYVLVDRTGQVCGTFSLRRIGDERMHLSRFGIDPALRRRGLGKFMLGTASDLARTDGATLFTLVVYEHNAPARRLYESCGFVPSHEQHKLDPDQVLMELRL